ncbi:MAG: hypothetical protein RLZZ587_536 [Actinomycetota bacterium]
MPVSLCFTRFVTISAFMAVSAIGLSGCAPVAPDGDGTVIVELALDGAIAEAVTAEIQAAADAAEIAVEFRAVDQLSAPVVDGDVAQLDADLVLTNHVSELFHLADQRAITPVATLPGIDADLLFAEVGPQWTSVTANSEGDAIAFPVAMTLSSVTFMNPLAFAEHGYAVPSDVQGFASLVAQIEADNAGFPWCAGMENADLTGDPFIDWLAEFVVATAGPETYRAWLTGEVANDAPEIVAAAEAARDLLANHSVAKGESSALLSVGFANTVPMFDLVGTYGKQCFFVRESPDYLAFVPDVVREEVAAGTFRQVSAFPFFGASDSAVSTPIVDAVFAGVGRVDKDVVALVAAMGITPFGDDLPDTTNWVSARVQQATDGRTSPFAVVNSDVLSSAESVVLSPRTVWRTESLDELRAASVAFLAGDVDWATAVASAK